MGTKTLADATVETVESADGTRIACERQGDGPPLVLLHGGSETRRAWDRVRPHLAESFTLWVPDRRGRGDSGDAEAYGLDREVADVRAVVDAVDGTPSLFGHSFGGLVALAAAPEVDLDRLVLYEPAVPMGPDATEGLAARMADCLDADDQLGAMRLFIEEAGGVPDAEALPFWPDGVNTHLADTVVREKRAEERFALPAEPDISVPTLLLTGEQGPQPLREGVDALEARLPETRRVDLDDVGHLGTQSAPERVAEAVRSFLAE